MSIVGHSKIVGVGLIKNIIPRWHCHKDFMMLTALSKHHFTYRRFPHKIHVANLI